MKKFLFITICLGCFIFASSCKQGTKSSDNSLRFDTIQVNTLHYQNNDETQMPCHLQISFVFPEAGLNEGLLKNLQSAFIEKLIDPSLASLNPQQATDVFSKQYFERFDKVPLDEIYTQEELESKSDYPYYLILKDSIVYNKNNFLSFVVEKYVYEGGAHGSKEYYGYVVDLTTGKFVEEDDFAGVNYSRNLAELMVKKLAQKNGLTNPEELENIGYINIAEMVPNNNFTLDTKGITYYFNEYEIGAYFLGITQIFIPYEELKMYLSQDNPISAITGY